MKSQNVFSDAKEMAISRGAKILSWNYIIDYLADWYYPSFGNGNRGMESLNSPF